MPNYCSNKLTISGIPMLDHLDFNEIVAEPEDILHCPVAYLIKPSNHVQPEDEKPWFNWYDWHNDHWGTAWNAISPFIDGNTIYFDTAWSPAIPIAKKLMYMYPEAQIELSWYEPGMCYAGFINNETECDYQYGTQEYYDFLIREGFETEESLKEYEDNE